MSKLRLGLIFGGRSQEHEISIMSARSVYQAADKDKYDLIPFAISKKGYWLDPVRSLAILQDENVKEVPEDITSSISQSIKSFLDTELDLVFPVLHGPLERMAGYRDCWKCLIYHMWGQEYSVQQWVWIKEL